MEAVHSINRTLTQIEIKGSRIRRRGKADGNEFHRGFNSSFSCDERKVRVCLAD
jgi:hypothetical protein